MNKRWIVLILLGAIGFLLFYRKDVSEFGVTMVEKIIGLFDDLYKKWGDIRGIPWQLIKAVALTESNENPNAIGDNGNSFGMMQIQHWHYEAYGMTKEDMFDPNLNVQVGSGFLAEMVQKYGMEGGVQAYNLGETKFRRGVTSPDYLAKVMGQYNGLIAVA